MELSSTIDSVTVFRQSAVVYRRAALNGLKGKLGGELLLGGLPVALDDSTVAARVLGAQGVRVTQLRVEISVRADDNGAAAELTQVRLREQELSSRRRLLDQMAQQLSKIEVPERRKPVADSPPPDDAFQQRRALIEFRQQRLAAHQDQIRELDAELQKLSLQMGELLERAQHDHTLEKLVRLRLRGDDLPKEAELELSYGVPGAGWAPAYVFHFDRDLTMAEMTMRVAVAQRSGEDWENVELRVSTAEARRWQELPRLASQRIGKKQAEPRSGWRPPPTGTEQLYSDYDRCMATAVPAPPPPPPHEDEAEVLFEELLEEKMESFDSEFEELFGSGEEMFETAESGSAGGAAEGAFCEMAPPPMPAPLKKAKKRSAPVLASALLPAGGSQRDRRERARDQLQRRVQRQASEPESPAVQPSADQLGYDNLLMPGPQHQHRGRLVPATLEMQAKRAAEQAGFEHVDRLLAWLSRRIEQAQHVANHRTPSGLQRATTLDGFDYLYAGEQRVSVPGDGKFHSLALLTRTLPARSRFVTVPREAVEVFRLAEVEGPEQFGLAPGPADVYQGGEYLVTARLKAVAPGEVLELGLGVEQAIKVVRNSRYQESTSGLMGNLMQLKHKLEIKVANHLARDVRLEVRERLPRPADEEQEVKVKLGSVEPAWQAFDAGPELAEHAFRWQLQLEAAAEKTLTAEYVIELSSKLELQGGNRRES